MEIIAPIVILLLILFIFFKSRSHVNLMKGANLYSKGDIDKSLQYLKKAWLASPQKSKYGMHYAYFLLKAGKVNESEEVFIKVFKLKLKHDEEMLLRSNYALVLWKKDKLEEAIAMLEKVLETYKNSLVLGSLGYLLIQSKNYEKALEFNKMAYEYNDADKIILDNYGNILYLTGNLEEALNIYNKLEKLEPSFPDAYYNFGLLQLMLGNNQEAQRLFEKAKKYRISFLSTITSEDIEKKLTKECNT
jgi:tetratricopeptide (TPR) repeat protein